MNKASQLIKSYKGLNYKEYQKEKYNYIADDDTPYEILKDIIENNREEIWKARNDKTKVDNTDEDGLKYFDEVIEELIKEIHLIRSHSNFTPLKKSSLNNYDY